MGTPEFAVQSLKALVDEGMNVVAVVTQPDKPKGRGRRLEPPPVKVFAETHGIPVLQPTKIRTQEFYEELKRLAPDLICVAAYGKILPKNILDLPKYGCINVHASLLPRLRGAAPINWAIIRGDKMTGVTTMLMDEGMDTGDILLKEEVPIEDEDTAETLSKKLSAVGGKLLIETIKRLMDGTLKRTPQDASLATLAPMLTKEMGRIDWKMKAQEISNLIRGLIPWPTAYTSIGGKMVKIYKAKVTSGEGKPGTVIKAGEGRLVVATGEEALEILELQLEGGRRLTASEFLRGHKIEEGAVLGN